MMRNDVDWRWQVVREVLAALGVLALVLLSYGHQSNAVAAGGYLLPDGSMASFCSGGPAPVEGSASHAPCEACRIADGATLPGAICGVAERFAVAGRVGSLKIAASVSWPRVGAPLGSRAPPRV